MRAFLAGTIVGGMLLAGSGTNAAVGPFGDKLDAGVRFGYFAKNGDGREAAGLDLHFGSPEDRQEGYVLSLDKIGLDSDSGLLAVTVSRRFPLGLITGRNENEATVQPYVGVGFGYARVKSYTGMAYYETTHTQSGVALRGTVGLSIGRSLYLEADYIHPTISTEGTYQKHAGTMLTLGLRL